MTDPITPATIARLRELILRLDLGFPDDADAHLRICSILVSDRAANLRSLLDQLDAQAAEIERLTTDRQLHERLLTAPIEVLSREALAALGITKTQMASILGIERPHFYQWLKGSVTNPSKSGRLRDLLSLLHRTCITPHDPLRSHLITEPLAPGATPLVTQLAGNLKSPALASNLLQAASLNRTITREADERLARMRDRGHDTRIDQATLDTLDTTLTMSEWLPPCPSGREGDEHLPHI